MSQHEFDVKAATERAYTEGWANVAGRLGFDERRQRAGTAKLKGANTDTRSRASTDELYNRQLQMAQLKMDEIKEKLRQDKAKYDRNGASYTYYQNGKEMRGKSKSIPYSIPKVYADELAQARRNISDINENITRRAVEDRMDKKRDEIIEAEVKKKLREEIRQAKDKGKKIINDGSIDQNNLINKARAHVNSNTNANGKGKRPKLKRPRRR